jgi:hypothetical protein
MIEQYFNPDSTQTEPNIHWEEGRCIDMNAFDQLPRLVRDYINHHGCEEAIEDVLYEHIHAHGRDPELTLVYILEVADRVLH